MKNVWLPQNLTQLWACLDNEPDARFFAGGTDLLVQMRSRKVEAAAWIGLEKINEIKGIDEYKGSIRIGACVTHAQLLRHPLIAGKLSLLHKAIATLGSPPIRTMGTIGGNICTASPAGDTLPPLYVLQAEVEIASFKGTQRLPIRDFISGPGRTKLQQGEILAAIHIKPSSGTDLHHFEKVGQRKSMCCAIASFAALWSLSSSGRIEKARLAWGSVGPTIVMDQDIEGFLIGKKLTRETLDRAAQLVEQRVAPIDDVRASADYRRKVSGHLLLRLLHFTQGCAHSHIRDKGVADPPTG